MSAETILAAILWMAPHVGEQQGKSYADIIAFEARRYRVHPALVIAIGYGESRWRNGEVSKTNDYGLLQIHVNSRGSNRFYGREKELLEPRVNIREGFRILDMWRNHHNRWCGDKPHPWWAHYKYGRIVKSIKHTHKTQRLFDKLVKRFWRDSPRS
jgi:soluble lytic murein transglycosylase-like protein